MEETNDASGRNATEVLLAQFSVAFESTRFFQSHALAAFGLYAALSGGSIAVISSNVADRFGAIALAVLALLVSVVFLVFNMRAHDHWDRYYLLAREIEEKLGMKPLLAAQTSLQTRFLGFTRLLTALYVLSSGFWATQIVRLSL